MNHLPKIECKSISHKKQRYDTLGDYFNNGTVQFRISKLKKPEYELAILLHEILEWFLITQKGIKIKDIDSFDKAHLDSDDPGMLKEAPYHIEHKKATKLEKLAISLLGCDWKMYDNYLKNI